MATKPINMFQHTCERCGHVWANDAPHPRRCSKCKSAYWDVPKGVLKPGRPPRRKSG